MGHNRMLDQTEQWLIWTLLSSVLVTPANCLASVSVSHGNYGRSVLCLQKEKKKSFLIERKHAGKIERQKQYPSGESERKKQNGKQQKKDFFFLSILSICSIARHCDSWSQRLCTFWERV